MSSLSGHRFGQRIWIANNVEYAIEVERGTSKQAPRGMLNVSLAEVAAKHG